MTTKIDTVFKCTTCEKEFHPDRYTAKFCSIKCRRVIPWNKGKSFRSGIPKPWKIGAWVKEKNPNWTGQRPTYGGIHQWVRYNFGRPDTCSQCGIKGTGRFMQWANLSGNYLRERSDWMRMCRPCHLKFDKKRREMTGLSVTGKNYVNI